MKYLSLKRVNPFSVTFRNF